MTINQKLSSFFLSVFTIFIFSFLLLSVFPSITHAQECAGMSEKFAIQVLDEQLQPIEGAEVYVRYDGGTSFGEQYFKIGPKYTDKNGKVEVTLYNQGTNVRPIDCNIYINATIPETGIEGKKTIVFGKHGSVVTLKLQDVAKVRFLVTDQYNHPISNASVSIGERSKQTDENGRADFYVREGSINYFVSYKDGKKAGSLEAVGTKFQQVVLPKYSIRIEVVDDSGNPLPATIEIFGSEYQLTDGVFEKDETYGSEIRYIIRYQDKEKVGTIHPSEKQTEKIPFDIHPPEIKVNNKVDIVNNKPRITFKVSDKGEYATGVDATSIVFNYRVGDSPWNDAVVYQLNQDTFVGELSKITQSSKIEFRIAAKDNALNVNEITGFIDVVIENQGEGETQPTNESAQENGSENGNISTKSDNQTPSLFEIIGVILLVLAAGYVIYYIKFRRTQTQ